MQVKLRGISVAALVVVYVSATGSSVRAALDVFEREPELSEGLTSLDNVVLAPHIGSASVETRTRMALIAVENLAAAYRGERPKYVVNPEVYGP